MPKRPFIRKPKRKRPHHSFWDYEYTQGGNLKLSANPSEDLEKFTRWLARQKNTPMLEPGDTVTDLGCGNGRNLIYLARTFGVSGTGYDISKAAISQARMLGDELPISYTVRSIAGDLPLKSDSQTLVLDMMSSHFLNQNEREHLRDEIHRILKPGGWLFMKTFLSDEDLHTKRLLAEFPGQEANTYIHPVIGVPEHVFSEAELNAFIEEKFVVHKVYRSHKHTSKGKAYKRRTISVYAQKDPYQ